MQLVLNEDAFGPLQNDSVIIVIQVSRQPKLDTISLHSFLSPAGAYENQLPTSFDCQPRAGTRHFQDFAGILARLL